MGKLERLVVLILIYFGPVNGFVPVAKREASALSRISLVRTTAIVEKTAATAAETKNSQKESPAAAAAAATEETAKQTREAREKALKPRKPPVPVVPRTAEEKAASYGAALLAAGVTLASDLAFLDFGTKLELAAAAGFAANYYLSGPGKDSLPGVLLASAGTVVSRSMLGASAALTDYVEEQARVRALTEAAEALKNDKSSPLPAAAAAAQTAAAAAQTAAAAAPASSAESAAAFVAARPRESLARRFMEEKEKETEKGGGGAPLPDRRPSQEAAAAADIEPLAEPLAGRQDMVKVSKLLLTDKVSTPNSTAAPGNPKQVAAFRPASSSAGGRRRLASALARRKRAVVVAVLVAATALRVLALGR